LNALPTAKIVIVHGIAASDEQSVRRFWSLFPCAQCFFIAHDARELSYECIPEKTIDEIRGSLAEPLSRIPPFQLVLGVVGCSPPVLRLVDELRLISETDATCLLQGETGTGKELFARAMHYLSARKDFPFVPVNCGAVPDQLFENELFGHARGAYTDASQEQKGLFAYADHGTLFLDEVDCLSLSAQVKLLRVVQEREYRPIGSPRSMKADVRIIAATNSDLRVGVQHRQFRDDLFHRLNVLRFTMPPLRDRGADIPLLAHSFVREFATRYRRAAPSLTREAYEAIQQYDWPGNVRELQAKVERAVLLCRSGIIGPQDLELPLPIRSCDAMSMKSAKEIAIKNFECAYLSDLLARCSGNISQAARLAGKERRSLQRLMRKHNLSRTNFCHLGRAAS
jgi:two-component system response regulator GlrR